MWPKWWKDTLQMAVWTIIWTFMTFITVKCVLQCSSMGVNSDQELTGASVETPERIYYPNFDSWNIPASGSFLLCYGGCNKYRLKQSRMKIYNMRFHPSWFSCQYLCIPCYYNEGLIDIQTDTKKSTFGTDELATRVMTSLDFYSQQSVQVIRDAGASYTCTSFKSDFVEMIDEACTTKITNITRGLKISGIGIVNYLVRMYDGSAQMGITRCPLPQNRGKLP